MLQASCLSSAKENHRHRYKCQVACSGAWVCWGTAAEVWASAPLPCASPSPSPVVREVSRPLSSRPPSGLHLTPAGFLRMGCVSWELGQDGPGDHLSSWMLIRIILLCSCSTSCQTVGHVLCFPLLTKHAIVDCKIIRCINYLKLLSEWLCQFFLN